MPRVVAGSIILNGISEPLLSKVEVFGVATCWQPVLTAGYKHLRAHRAHERGERKYRFAIMHAAGAVAQP